MKPRSVCRSKLPENYDLTITFLISLSRSKWASQHDFFDYMILSDDDIKLDLNGILATLKDSKERLKNPKFLF